MSVPHRPATMEKTEHGYNRYTYGCRCEVCRDAKAAYVRASRERRRRALRLVRQVGAGRNYVAGITHGYAGYQDYACRCDVCMAARRERDVKYYRAVGRLVDA